MSGVDKKKSAKNADAAEVTIPAAVGRKRDQTADTRIIEAAIETLAEAGFDAMTMDMVAARAKAGKATLYRRWPSKAELVRDAIIWMSRSSVDLDKLPDTGALREDLLALLKPYSKDFAEKKLRVISGLGSFFTEHRALADEATAGIFDPWTEANRSLMLRAAERGEISAAAPIELACRVIVAMTAHRTLTEKKAFDKTMYASLVDQILLPALRA